MSFLFLQDSKKIKFPKLSTKQGFINYSANLILKPEQTEEQKERPGGRGGSHPRPWWRTDGRRRSSGAYATAGRTARTQGPDSYTQYAWLRNLAAGSRNWRRGT